MCCIYLAKEIYVILYFMKRGNQHYTVLPGKPGKGKSTLYCEHLPYLIIGEGKYTSYCSSRLVKKENIYITLVLHWNRQSYLLDRDDLERLFKICLLSFLGEGKSTIYCISWKGKSTLYYLHYSKTLSCPNWERKSWYCTFCKEKVLTILWFLYTLYCTSGKTR